MIPVNTIICGDCLEVMKEWPDNCVDLVCTDPPYNVGINYANSDDKLTKQQYENRIKCLLSEFCRFTGNILLVLGSSSKIVLPWWNNLPGSSLIIVKMGAFSHNRINGFSLQYHTILTAAKNISHTWQPDLWENIRWPGEGYYFNEDRYGHPAMTPLALAKKCIELFSTPGTIICDPFVGSGTFCVAAKMLGRRYIGIDISSKYCEIARLRLEAVDTGVPVKERQRGQIPLFAEQVNGL